MELKVTSRKIESLGRLSHAETRYTLLVIRVTRVADGEGSVTRRPIPAGLLIRRGSAVHSGGGVKGELAVQDVELRVGRPRGAGTMGTTVC